jgi:hypothetical protein
VRDTQYIIAHCSSNISPKKDSNGMRELALIETTRRREIRLVGALMALVRGIGGISPTD